MRLFLAAATLLSIGSSLLAQQEGWIKWSAKECRKIAKRYQDQSTMRVFGTQRPPFDFTVRALTPTYLKATVRLNQIESRRNDEEASGELESLRSRYLVEGELTFILEPYWKGDRRNRDIPLTSVQLLEGRAFLQKASWDKKVPFVRPTDVSPQEDGSVLLRFPKADFLKAEKHLFLLFAASDPVYRQPAQFAAHFRNFWKEP